MLKENKAIIKPASEKLLYIKPVKREKSYLNRKLTAYENNKNLIFCCIGSLDQATENDRKTLLEWLKKILNIKI